MSKDIQTLITSEHYQAELAKALPRHITPDRFARVFLTTVGKTPKLKECTPASLLKCCMDCSALGLEPDNRRAYLIPYGKEATLIIGYQGLVELVRRSGDVTAIRAETVCEQDAFSWANGVIDHQIDWRNPRGNVQAVYAEAKLKSGEVQTAVMTRDEVEGIRRRSKAGTSGPWVSDWAEMAKKTAVRRLVKMLPMSSEIHQAIERDDEAQFPMRNVTRTAPTPMFLQPADVSEPEAEPESADVETANAGKEDW
jgi:recombination protein RecT